MTYTGQKKPFAGLATQGTAEKIIALRAWHHIDEARLLTIKTDPGQKFRFLLFLLFKTFLCQAFFPCSNVQSQDHPKR